MNNPTDQLLYRIVRKEIKNNGSPTVQHIAEEAGVSRSTVYRFAHHLGYKSWQECIRNIAAFCTAPRDKAEIDYEALASAIKELHGGVVLVDAIGDAEVCREHLIERLGGLGIITLSYDRTTCEQLAHRGIPGLAYVINESGFVLAGTCRTCKKCGYDVVAITADSNSLVARSADLCIIIGNKKSSIQDYEPNYFAAGALIVLERMAAHLEALLLQ